MQGIGPAGAASIASALLDRELLLSLSLANNPLTSTGDITHDLTALVCACQQQQAAVAATCPT